jgi:DMSO/TMAO reductase YedYZ molybdopterin-dependent catalytic subunit
MKNKTILVLAVLLAAACILGACGAPEQAAPSASGENVVITGLDKGDIALTIGDIKAAKTFSGKVEGADSAGKPVKYDIKGAYFGDILEKNGYKQQDLAGIRIVASDGYSIEVPHDILAARDVIFAYEMDGKALDKDNAPMRVFIPNERAMYWVRMASKIEVLAEEAADTVNGIFLMESLYSPADYADYEFIGQKYKTLDTKKILSDNPGSGGDVVLITGADGLLKNETLENFYKGAINMTGEDTPEFFSNTLPSGMFVKNLMLIKYGGNAFAFAAKALEKDKSLTLKGLLDLCKMAKAESYTLKFKDGGTKTIPAAELKDWAVTAGAEAGAGLSKGASEKMPGLVSVGK